MTDDVVASDIRDFLLAHIDSIAQLEALLLLRANPSEPWDAARAARRLYVSERESHEALARLYADGLLSQSEGGFRYTGVAAETARMVDRLAEAYAAHLIPITNIIHQKPGRIREFADAFKFKSKREP
jgi:Mn-dependent DtxR family transcriptional regulator